MSTEFQLKGRVVVPGVVSAQALVSTEPCGRHSEAAAPAHLRLPLATQPAN